MPAFMTGHVGTEEKDKGRKKTIDKKRKRDVQDVDDEDVKDEGALDDTIKKEWVDDDVVRISLGQGHQITSRKIKFYELCLKV